MGCLSVSVLNRNSLKVTAVNRNSLTVSAVNRNSLEVTASLVCSVSPSVWEYFNVAEGPLLVEEGFFKVHVSSNEE